MPDDVPEDVPEDGAALDCGPGAIARRMAPILAKAVTPGDGPIWVQLLNLRGDAFDLALSQPGVDLLGWEAPPECFAVGTVASARLRRLDEGCELPASLVSGLGGGVRVVCLVTRTGEIGWHMVLPDGTTFDRTPEEGRMLDVLRRCFGLPTPPPPTPVGRLHSMAWMAAILEQEASGPAVLSWRQALGLHPAVSTVTPGGRRAASAADREELIREAARSKTWESMRLTVASDPPNPAMPPARVAAWMDDGMFARWVLASLPSLEEMIAAVRPLLVPSAARRLAHLARSVA